VKTLRATRTDARLWNPLRLTHVTYFRNKIYFRNKKRPSRHVSEKAFWLGFDGITVQLAVNHPLRSYP